MKREDLVAMGPLQRKALLEDVATLVHSREWRFGDAVRFLRAVVLRKNRGAVGLVFPRMEPPPVATVDLEQRHASLRAALAGTKRRKRPKD